MISGFEQGVDLMRYFILGLLLTIRVAAQTASVVIDGNLADPIWKDGEFSAGLRK